jgi:hypothetical protein
MDRRIESSPADDESLASSKLRNYEENAKINSSFYLFLDCENNNEKNACSTRYNIHPLDPSSNMKHIYRFGIALIPLTNVKGVEFT